MSSTGDENAFTQQGFRAYLYILKHVDNFVARVEKRDVLSSIIGRF